MTRFLKLPFQLFWGLLKALQTLLFGLIALGLFLVLVAAPFSDDGSQMPDDGALVLNPSGVLVEEKIWLLRLSSPAMTLASQSLC